MDTTQVRPRSQQTAVQERKRADETLKPMWRTSESGRPPCLSKVRPPMLGTKVRQRH